MAENNNIGGDANQAREAFISLAQELQRVKPSLKTMAVDVNSMVSGFNQMSKGMKMSADLAESMQRAYRKNDLLVASINTKLRETNATQAQVEAASERINNINENAYDIATAMEQSVQDLYKLEVARSSNLTGVYASQAAEYKLMVDKGLLSTEAYDQAIKMLREQQKRQKHLEEEVKLQEEIADRILEIREESEKYKKILQGVLATSRAIANDPKAMGAFAINEGVKALEKLHEGFEQFHEMGLTGGQALEAQMQSLSVASLAGLSDTKGAIQGIYEEYGTMGAASAEITDHIGHLSHEMGISGQEAAKLTAQMQQISGESLSASTETLEYTKNLAKANGVAPGKLTREMAANTKDIARFSKEGTKGFADAAMQAQKMNVSLNSMVSMADSLLDFESSIEKQMEASALIGKEINFDKARQLALEGKSADAAAEVLKQVGGAAEFQKMNVLQQKKLAEAAGLTVDELTKGLQAQEGNVQMTGEAEKAQSGFLANLLMMGGGAMKLMQEYGMAMMVVLQFLSSEVAMSMVRNVLLFARNVLLGIGQAIMSSGWIAQKAHWVAEKAHAAWQWVTENTMFGKWMANMAAKRAARTAEAAQDKALAAQKAATSAGGGGAGAGAGLRGVASGLSAMGTGKVLFGALNLLIAAPALLLMVAALPFLIAISMLGVPAGIGLKAAAAGIKSFGNGKVLMGAGVMLAAAVALLALGAATIFFAQGGVAGTALMIVSLIALTAALAVLGGLGMSGLGEIGVGLLLAVGVAMLLLGAAVLLAAYGISLVVDSFTKMFEVVSMENIGALMLLGPALFLIGTGMLVMAAGLLVAAPALLMFGLASIVAAVGIAALGIGFVLLGVGVAMVAGGFFLLSKVLNMEFVSVLAALVPVAGMLALGLVALGISALVATPGLVIGAFAIGAFAVSMGLLAAALTAAIPGMLVLIQLGSMAGAFAEIALSMAAMAAGIAAFATAGIMTLPTIMGLIALSFVAPILTALGDSINYDLEGPSKVESSPESDKMDILIDEIRGLKAVMAQGGVINMDGKKVGDVLRLNISTSNLK